MEEADEKITSINYEYILRYFAFSYSFFLFSSVFVGVYIYVLDIPGSHWFVSIAFFIIPFLGMLLFLSNLYKKYAHALAISLFTLLFSWLVTINSGGCDVILPALLIIFYYFLIYFSLVSIVLFSILFLKYKKEKETDKPFKEVVNVIIFILIVLSIFGIEIKTYDVLFFSLLILFTVPLCFISIYPKIKNIDAISFDFLFWGFVAIVFSLFTIKSQYAYSFLLPYGTALISIWVSIIIIKLLDLTKV